LVGVTLRSILWMAISLWQIAPRSIRNQTPAKSHAMRRTNPLMVLLKRLQRFGQKKVLWPSR
jgi:hypothetical protein